MSTAHERRAWTAEEDNAIVKLVDEIGTKRWSIIAERLAAMRLAGTKRTGKQCRTRWLNHLDPTINKGPWTKEEERTIYEAQKKLGMFIFIIHHTYVLQHIFQICIYIYIVIYRNIYIPPSFKLIDTHTKQTKKKQTNISPPYMQVTNGLILLNYSLDVLTMQLKTIGIAQ